MYISKYQDFYSIHNIWRFLEEVNYYRISVLEFEIQKRIFIQIRIWRLTLGLDVALCIV